MRIAVLISGGVDSAVVVHKLFEEGHDLHLFYIKIGRDDDSGDCAYEEDIEICSLIAAKYNLPLEIVSLHEEYWDYVMDYTLKTVQKGETPHPDMMCNKIIKFGFFESKWGKHFDKTATGHYAGIDFKNNKYYLTTAKDPVKDQTDFLAQIDYNQLSHLLFPLGEMNKSEVRELAEKIRLPNASRKDSQGICFLGKINYADFIKRHLGEKEGAVIEIETGKKIGTHKGYWFYTIGQRKGLGLGGGPWFVVRKNIKDNVLFVSKGYDTPLQYDNTIYVENPHWITETPEFFNARDSRKIRIAFKTRHTPEFSQGFLLETKHGFLVKSDVDIQGIAPGQYVTFYSSDHKYCLGSAKIINKPKTDPSNLEVDKTKA